MRGSEHAGHRLLMHSVHTSHLWLKVSPCVSFHIIHACALVSWFLECSLFTVSLLLPPFLFQLYLMSIPAPVVTLDNVTPLTGYEPKEMELTDADELNLATSSNIHFNVPDFDDDELAEFLAVVIDRTGQPVEVRSNNDQFSCDTRNLKSAQNQFPSVTQPKRMIN